MVFKRNGLFVLRKGEVDGKKTDFLSELREQKVGRDELLYKMRYAAKR